MYVSFVIALVLIASAVSPAHSAALGYVVLLNLAILADLFVAFVEAPQTTLLLAIPPQRTHLLRLILLIAPFFANAPRVERDICHHA